jgi:P4 family phage/plasmid primase-like protien
MTRDVTPEEYEPLARMVAKKLDMELFDDTTYQFSRVMFLPSRAVDGDEFAEENFGEWIDPDYTLSKYKDWRDFGCWPQSSREKERGGLRARHEKAADPFSIPGIIGAFNRAFPVDEAIVAFDLPYTPSGKGDERYTYLDGSSADGAVFYPDDGHLFSHHESDPAHGNRNAWDLVRLHKFGDFTDEEIEQSVPVMKRASSKSMTALALDLPEVQEELQVKGEEEFDDLGELEVTDHDTGEKVKLQKTDLTRQGIETYLNACLEEKLRLSLKEYKEAILRIAAAGAAIEETDREALAERIKVARGERGVTKIGVLKEIKSKRKQLSAGGENGDELKDIQVEFIRTFLKQHFKGGAWLRRTGKQFWVYNGTHWEPEDDEVIKGQMVDTLVDLRVNTTSRKENRQLAAAVGENQTSAIFSSLWGMFTAIQASETGGGSDPMGLRRQFLPEMINCTNGTIVFRKDERGKHDGKFKLRSNNPEDLLTAVVDANYVKDATCPIWDEFCQTTFQRSDEPWEMQRHLEELLGYIMNQSRSMRAWVLFYGGTGSGKSTVASVINSLLGEAAKNMSMLNYDGSNSHATAGLIGKQVLIDDDYPEGLMLNDGFLKTVSEEKRLEANPKGRDEYQFVARVVPMILSNNPPATKDISGALADRALVFPFNHMIPREERNPARMRHMVEAEREGILARCVRGYARLLARGDWDFPADCTRAWENWIAESNPLQMFVHQALVADDPGAVTKAADVYEAYRMWWRNESHGSSSERLSVRRNAFYRKVEQILRRERRRDRELGWVWDGVSIKERYRVEFDD